MSPIPGRTRTTIISAFLVAIAGADEPKTMQNHMAPCSPTEPQFFLMLQAPRSGSDWLKSLLNSHADVHCTSTLVKTDDMKRLDTPGAFDKAFNSAADRHSKAAKFTDASLSRGVAIGAKEGIWVGKNKTDADRLRAHAFGQWLRQRRVKLIMLERVSVGRVVSGAKNIYTHNATEAWSSNNVHCLTAECAAKVRSMRVTLDAAHIRGRLEQDRRDWDSVLQWADANVPPSQRLHVTYDHLVANTADEMRKIFRLLCVETPAAPPKSKMVKSGSSQIVDGIVNLEEVRGALRGTIWEHELVR